MNSLISPQKQLGMGLIFFGLLFLFLGVILFFDRFLLAVGNLLFLSSFPVLIGVTPALNFFNPFYGGDGRFKGKKLAGSGLFFLGFFLVCFLGWTKLGFFIQLGGAVPLFQNLDFLRILRSIPFVSQALSFVPGFRVEKTAGSNV